MACPGEEPPGSSHCPPSTSSVFWQPRPSPLGKHLPDLALLLGTGICFRRGQSACSIPRPRQVNGSMKFSPETLWGHLAGTTLPPGVAVRGDVIRGLLGGLFASIWETCEKATMKKSRSVTWKGFLTSSEPLDPVIPKASPLPALASYRAQ